MPTSLDTLLQDLPLSACWQRPELFTETVVISGQMLYTAGLAATHQCGRTVTGSAGQLGFLPLERAYFELLERTAIAEIDFSGSDTILPRRNLGGDLIEPISFADAFQRTAPDESWQFSRSNGVAAARNWAHAIRSAKRELVERDVILRAWAGEIKPCRVDFKSGMIPGGWDEHYSFEAHTFEDPMHSDLHVALLVGFPRQATKPLVYGFGCRDALDDAVFAATIECFQRLGFLWDCGPTEEQPVFSPTPDYHQEVFLQPHAAGRLEQWLHGEHLRFGCQPALVEADAWSFAELTPAHLIGKIHVVRAINPNRRPLVFGEAPFPWVRALPETLRIHPVA